MKQHLNTLFVTTQGAYLRKDGEAEQAQQDRVVDSATYLSEHMAEAPALVLGCTAGRVDGVGRRPEHGGERLAHAVAEERAPTAGGRGFHPDR